MHDDSFPLIKNSGCGDQVYQNGDNLTLRNVSILVEILSARTTKQQQVRATRNDISGGKGKPL